jgi:hypothetical protein
MNPFEEEEEEPYMKNMEPDSLNDIPISNFICNNQIPNLDEKSISNTSTPYYFLLKEPSFILSPGEEEIDLPKKFDKNHSNTHEDPCNDDTTKSNSIKNKSEPKKDDITMINKVEKTICGRKKKHPSDKSINNVHDKYSPDNIQRKVQVHFLSFVVDFLNVIIATQGFAQKFIDIDYSIKKQVKKDKVSKLKKETIGELLCEKVSSKFKKQIQESEFKNKIIYEEIRKSNNEGLNFIFSQSLISFFKNVYCQKEKVYVINGETITFSDRVQNYEDLLDECDNDRYREKIKEEVQNTYFKKLFKVNDKKNEK